MCHTQPLEMIQPPPKRPIPVGFGQYLTNDKNVITLVQPTQYVVGRETPMTLHIGFVDKFVDIPLPERHRVERRQ
jgi:hypothetical protein